VVLIFLSKIFGKGKCEYVPFFGVEVFHQRSTSFDNVHHAVIRHSAGSAGSKTTLSCVSVICDVSLLGFWFGDGWFSLISLSLPV
jgi:hypothetical protein